MSITVPGTFANANLPVGGQALEAIIADSRIVDWWQADTTAAEQISGLVSLFTSLKSGRSFSAAGAATQGSLVPQEALAGYDAIALDGTNDVYTATSIPDFTGSFSIGVVFAPATGANNNKGILLQRDSSTSLTGFYTNSAGGLQAQHCAGNTSGLVGGALVEGMPYFARMGVSGSTLKARVNNGLALTAAITGNAPTSSFALGAFPALTASSFFNGWVADWFVANVDLFDPAHGDLHAHITDYFAAAYGLALTV